ncbi:UvrD-helicase domain-containing protein [Fusobacterium sp. MFO224]|uniref:UvrD-helicase domain-containing protein n=1 Tax=Fusobacterium sp. MFO224 TaxID=3378070 RepID=UPI003851F2A0
MYENEIKNIDIKQNEFEKIYQTLFNSKGNFDERAIQVISNFESCCVNAAPGSGKTTTLVAKLISILEKNISFSKGKGICILTHTNVGIDIIKEKLGERGEKLFKYPNYIGTLQSFIDKFLAIPHYKNKFKNNIKYIDDHLINSKLYLLMNANRRLGTFIKKKSWLDPKTIYFNFEDKKIYYGKGTVLLNNSSSDSYKELYQRIENGFLKYKEAIQLGELYLKEKPSLKKYFSDRFSLVIVDEMQDTSDKAFNVLENIFDKKNTIVQYIGDPFQNIMDGTSSWMDATQKKLCFNRSKRFGGPISSLLTMISGEQIIGNPDMKSVKPKLFLYDDLDLNENNGGNRIFDKFIEEVKKYGLDTKKGTFKVTGRVGKKNDSGHITIPNYFKNYFGGEKKAKENMQFQIKQNLGRRPENIIIIEQINKRIKSFFYFNKIDIKLFKESMENKVKKNELNTILYKYLKDKKIDELNKAVCEFLCENIKEFIPLKDKFQLYIDDDKETEEVNNTYSNEGVDLEISTIHGVKGETHLATLYLDTYFNKKYDVSDILLDICLKKKLSSKKKMNETKNILYVGCSRPKFLLCLTCKKEKIERLTKDDLNKIKEIFELIYV